MEKMEKPSKDHMDLTGITIMSLREYLDALHQKYMDSEYDVKVSMLHNSTEKNSITKKSSLTDLENEINRVMDEIHTRKSKISAKTN